MVQEEIYSNSSSGGGSGGGEGKSSKKLNQKKIPQRGLGGVRWEKTRLEEQQQKNKAVAAVGTSACSVHLFPLHHHKLSSSTPFTPFPTDLSSKSSLFRPPPIPISTLDLFVPPIPVPTITSSHSGSGCGGDGGGPHDHFPTMWNIEFNHNGDDSNFDPGLTCRTYLQNDPSDLLQRKQQHSSMVNVSSSSGLDFQIELPLNQSCISNYLPTLWPKEHIYMDGLPNCKNGTSGSIAIDVDWGGSRSELNFGNGIKENGALDGNFLTLGPPTTTSSSMTSKSKQTLAIPTHYEFSELDFHPSQGIMEDPLFQLGGSIQQQALPNFSPGGVMMTTNNWGGEAGNSVDLNLKL